MAHGTPNVRTTTGNLAALVAFTRALQWALHDPDARVRPICVRYSNEYAANIASGVWRPKKHNAMAEEARCAWAALKRAKPRGVWMQHGRGAVGDIVGYHREPTRSWGAGGRPTV